MRYDAAERLKIDYESLKAINPKLIYCHTRGFETGPREGLPGNDQTGACLAGVQWEDGGMSGGGKPLWSFTSLGDTGNGFLSAIAIIQALYHRERTGEGQFCDTSIVNAHLLEQLPTRSRVRMARGFERPKTDARQLGHGTSSRLYETGRLVVHCAAGTGGLGSLLHRDGPREPYRRCALCERRKRAPRISRRCCRSWRRSCASAPRRSGLRASMRRRSRARSQTRASPWACTRIRSSRLAAGWPPTSTPSSASSNQIGLLFDFSETPGRVQGPPLIVGQHSREILAELGYSAEQIEELCKDCVLAWSLKEGHRKVRSPWQPQAPAPVPAESKT